MRPLVLPLVRPIARAIADAFGIFSPAYLYANGEQGAWYDPSDLSTLFQDSAGTIPVTATGQPVGHVRDKSGNGRHLTQVVVGNQPILRQDSLGHYYLELNGTTQYLGVASSADDFRYLHDGTGCIAMVAFALDSPLIAAKTYPLFGTANGSAANRGAAIYTLEAVASNITTQQQFSTISNGTTTVINGSSGGQGSVRGDGRGQVFGYAYGTQAGADFFAYIDGDNFNLGRAESAVPSVADSAASLRIGNVHGSSFTPGRFYGGLIRAGLQTTEDRRFIVNYLKSLYGDYGHIIGVGDSHTYNTAYTVFMRDFYPARLEAARRAASGSRAVSLNYGVSGDTTAQIIARMSSVLEQGTPELAVVYAGQNDVAIDTQTNLQTIVATINAAGCNRVLLVGAHYMNFAVGGDTTTTQEPTFSTLRVKQSAAASASGAAYVDMYAYMRALIVGGFYTQGDDLAWHVAVGNTHLNATGEQILADAIFATMQSNGWV